MSSNNNTNTNQVSNSLEFSNFGELEDILKKWKECIEWVDILHWISSLQKFLHPIPSKSIDAFPSILKIAGYLTSCLSGKNPTGVHIQTIQTYSLIFDKLTPIGVESHFPILFPGIFLVFQHLASPLRTDISNLFTNHIYHIPFSLIKPFLPSILSNLLCCIIPQGTGIATELLSKLVKIAKDDFPVSFWRALVNSHDARYNGFQFWTTVKFSLNTHYECISLLSDCIRPVEPLQNLESKSLISSLARIETVPYLWHPRDAIYSIRMLLDWILEHLPVDTLDIEHPSIKKFIASIVSLILLSQPQISRRISIYINPIPIATIADILVENEPNILLKFFVRIPDHPFLDFQKSKNLIFSTICTISTLQHILPSDQEYLSSIIQSNPFLILLDESLQHSHDNNQTIHQSLHQSMTYSRHSSWLKISCSTTFSDPQINNTEPVSEQKTSLEKVTNLSEKIVPLSLLNILFSDLSQTLTDITTIPTSSDTISLKISKISLLARIMLKMLETNSVDDFIVYFHQLFGSSRHLAFPVFTKYNSPDLTQFSDFILLRRKYILQYAAIDLQTIPLDILASLTVILLTFHTHPIFRYIDALFYAASMFPEKSTNQTTNNQQLINQWVSTFTLFDSIISIFSSIPQHFQNSSDLPTLLSIFSCIVRLLCPLSVKVEEYPSPLSHTSSSEHQLSEKNQIETSRTLRTPRQSKQSRNMNEKQRKPSVVLESTSSFGNKTREFWFWNYWFSHDMDFQTGDIFRIDDSVNISHIGGHKTESKSVSPIFGFQLSTKSWIPPHLAQKYTHNPSLWMPWIESMLTKHKLWLSSCGTSTESIVYNPDPDEPDGMKINSHHFSATKGSARLLLIFFIAQQLPDAFTKLISKLFALEFGIGQINELPSGTSEHSDTDTEKGSFQSISISNIIHLITFSNYHNLNVSYFESILWLFLEFANQSSRILPKEFIFFHQWRQYFVDISMNSSSNSNDASTGSNRQHVHNPFSSFQRLEFSSSVINLFSIIENLFVTCSSVYQHILYLVLGWCITWTPKIDASTLFFQRKFVDPNFKWTSGLKILHYLTCKLNWTKVTNYNSNFKFNSWFCIDPPLFLDRHHSTIRNTAFQSTNVNKIATTTLFDTLLAWSTSCIAALVGDYILYSILPPSFPVFIDVVYSLSPIPINLFNFWFANPFSHLFFESYTHPRLFSHFFKLYSKWSIDYSSNSKFSLSLSNHCITDNSPIDTGTGTGVRKHGYQFPGNYISFIHNDPIRLPKVNYFKSLSQHQHQQHTVGDTASMISMGISSSMDNPNPSVERQLIVFESFASLLPQKEKDTIFDSSLFFSFPDYHLNIQLNNILPDYLSVTSTVSDLPKLSISLYPWPAAQSSFTQWISLLPRLVTFDRQLFSSLLNSLQATEPSSEILTRSLSILALYSSKDILLLLPESDLTKYIQITLQSAKFIHQQNSLLTSYSTEGIYRFLRSFQIDQNTQKVFSSFFNLFSAQPIKFISTIVKLYSQANQTDHSFVFPMNRTELLNLMIFVLTVGSVVTSSKKYHISIAQTLNLRDSLISIESIETVKSTENGKDGLKLSFYPLSYGISFPECASHIPESVLSSPTQTALYIRTQNDSEDRAILHINWETRILLHLWEHIQLNLLKSPDTLDFFLTLVEILLVRLSNFITFHNTITPGVSFPQFSSILCILSFIFVAQSKLASSISFIQWESSFTEWLALHPHISSTFDPYSNMHHNASQNASQSVSTDSHHSPRSPRPSFDSTALKLKAFQYSLSIRLLFLWNVWISVLQLPFIDPSLNFTQTSSFINGSESNLKSVSVSEGHHSTDHHSLMSTLFSRLSSTSSKSTSNTDTSQSSIGHRSGTGTGITNGSLYDSFQNDISSAKSHTVYSLEMVMQSHNLLWPIDASDYFKFVSFGFRFYRYMFLLISHVPALVDPPQIFFSYSNALTFLCTLQYSHFLVSGIILDPGHEFTKRSDQAQFEFKTAIGRTASCSLFSMRLRDTIIENILVMWSILGPFFLMKSKTVTPQFANISPGTGTHGYAIANSINEKDTCITLGSLYPLQNLEDDFELINEPLDLDLNETSLGSASLSENFENGPNLNSFVKDNNWTNFTQICNNVNQFLPLFDSVLVFFARIFVDYFRVSLNHNKRIYFETVLEPLSPFMVSAFVSPLAIPQLISQSQTNLTHVAHLKSNPNSVRSSESSEPDSKSIYASRLIFSQINNWAIITSVIHQVYFSFKSDNLFALRSKDFTFENLTNSIKNINEESPLATLFTSTYSTMNPGPLVVDTVVDSTIHTIISKKTNILFPPPLSYSSLSLRDSLSLTRCFSFDSIHTLEKLLRNSFPHVNELVSSKDLAFQFLVYSLFDNLEIINGGCGGGVDSILNDTANTSTQIASSSRSTLISGSGSISESERETSETSGVHKTEGEGTHDPKVFVTPNRQRHSISWNKPPMTPYSPISPFTATQVTASTQKTNSLLIQSFFTEMLKAPKLIAQGVVQGFGPQKIEINGQDADALNTSIDQFFSGISDISPFLKSLNEYAISLSLFFQKCSILILGQSHPFFFRNQVPLQDVLQHSLQILHTLYRQTEIPSYVFYHTYNTLYQSIFWFLSTVVHSLFCSQSMPPPTVVNPDHPVNFASALQMFKSIPKPSTSVILAKTRDFWSQILLSCSSIAPPMALQSLSPLPESEFDHYAPFFSLLQVFPSHFDTILSTLVVVHPNIFHTKLAYTELKRNYPITDGFASQIMTTLMVYWSGSYALSSSSSSGGNNSSGLGFGSESGASTGAGQGLRISQRSVQGDQNHSSLCVLYPISFTSFPSGSISGSDQNESPSDADTTANVNSSTFTVRNQNPIVLPLLSQTGQFYHELSLLHWVYQMAIPIFNCK